MDFKSFFSFKTPHTREHQQSLVRSVDRKHLNQVPYSKNIKKAHPYISTILKNKTKVFEKISKNLARELANSYNIIDIDSDLNFIKSLNRTKVKLIKRDGLFYTDYTP